MFDKYDKYCADMYLYLTLKIKIYYSYRTGPEPNQNIYRFYRRVLMKNKRTEIERVTEIEICK